MVTPSLSPAHSEKTERLLCGIFKRSENGKFEETGWKVFVYESNFEKIPVVLKKSGIQIGYKVNFDNRNYLEQFDTWDSILDYVSVSACHNGKLPEVFDTFGLLEMLVERADGTYLLDFGETDTHVLNRMYVGELKVFSDMIDQKQIHWVNHRGVLFHDGSSSLKLAPFSKPISMDDRVAVYTSKAFSENEKDFSEYVTADIVNRYSTILAPERSDSDFEKISTNMMRLGEFESKDETFRFIFIEKNPYTALNTLKRDIDNILAAIGNPTIRSELTQIVHQFYWENPSRTDEMGIIRGVLKIRREINNICTSIGNLRAVR